MALAADRKTPSKRTHHTSSGPLAASTVLYRGALVAANAAGNLVPAAITAGLRVVGVTTRKTDNSAGLAGALEAQWETGVFAFKNDATYPITQADVGRACYVKDDQTVQDERSGSPVVAGIVFAYESATVIWVLVGPEVSTLMGAGVGGIELVTSGALSAFVERSHLSVTGTVADFVLPDGRYVGQRKVVELTAVSGTPIGTLTPTTVYAGQPATWVFTDVGQRVEFVWTATGWKATRVVSAGVETLTAGQTANRLKLYHVFAVADTVDVLQPDGVCPGDLTIWAASANSGTPVGTVSGLFRTVVGGAGTDINFNAAGDACACVWDGAKWAPSGALTSATIS